MKLKNILKQKSHSVFFFLLFLSFLFLIQCGRFKIEKLEPEEIFNIKIDKKNLDFPSQSGNYFEIPSKVGVYEKWLVISEPSNHLVKIFEENELKTIIIASGFFEKYKKEFNEKTVKTKNKVKLISNDHLSIPGRIVTAEESFYVLNYYPANLQDKNTNLLSKGSYKILSFSLKGKFLNIIGRNAEPDLPFQDILWMDVDTDNHFWVFFNHLDNLELAKYENKKFTISIKQKDCEKNLFASIERKKDYIYKCEYMYPFYSGQKVLLVGKVTSTNTKNQSVGGHIFKYRIFKVKDLSTNKSKIIFDNFNDPEDFPYLPFSDDRIMIWQTKGYNTIKYAIYDLEGNLLTNYQIELKGLRNLWRTTYSNLNASFYSIKVEDKALKIIQWK